MPKVSPATSIDWGLVGPKVRQKCVADGQQVNIPVHYVVRPSKTGRSDIVTRRLRSDLIVIMTERGASKGGTHSESMSWLMIPVQVVSLCFGW